MLIKINRKEITLNIGDVFLDNGSCIILMSQKIYSSGTWTRQINPTVPKKVWKSIQNTFEFRSKPYGKYPNMSLYTISEVKNAETL